MQPAVDALAGRVILVAGAHGGLGSAAAQACAAAGATVVLLGRKTQRLNRVYDAIVAAGGAQPGLYPLDLEGATPADYAQMAERIGEECGRLDGVLHTAAAFKGLVSLGNTPPEDWLRGLHANLTAPLLLTQACLPLLGNAADSAVVFTINDRATTSRAYWGAYGIAQHGLHGLVAMLGDELSNGPVRVHGLQPGPMRTALRARAWASEDAAQWPPAEVYAAACVWLLSPAARPQHGQVLEARA
jgi:NAD(P)-dependent dehydrogenase (short-subunit alcohol dehydrogenase family)